MTWRKSNTYMHACIWTYTYKHIYSCTCTYMRTYIGLKNRFDSELKTVALQYPFEEFKFQEPSLRLDFKDGVKMLQEIGEDIGDYDDIGK